MSFLKKVILLAVIFIYSSLITAQNKYNLNFDEFDTENSKMPKDWFKLGFYDGLSGEKFDENNTVGKVVSDKKGKFGCITYRVPANYEGDTIKLSGKMKIEKVKDFAGLLMRIDGYSKHSNLGFNSMQGLKINGTRDWEEYSIQLPFPSNANTYW